MNEQDWLAQRFEEDRRRLRAVAYRMLGSVSEAEDAVQEAWLRLSGSEPGEIENLSGWLTTVVARVSLNMLRSRAVRREQPLSPHLPDPIVDPADGVDPEHEAMLADSVGLAMLVVLETLTPPERLAFVLHDMFGVPFEEIAALLARSPQAARQLASRARRRVRAQPTTPDVDVSGQREVVNAFLAAAREGGHVVAGRPHHASRAGHRRRRRDSDPQRCGVRDRLGHRPQRKDRRNGLPRRPRTAHPTRRDDSRQP